MANRSEDSQSPLNKDIKRRSKTNYFMKSDNSENIFFSFKVINNTPSMDTKKIWLLFSTEYDVQ